MPVRSVYGYGYRDIAYKHGSSLAWPEGAIAMTPLTHVLHILRYTHGSRRLGLLSLGPGSLDIVSVQETPCVELGRCLGLLID